MKETSEGKFANEITDQVVSNKKKTGFGSKSSGPEKGGNTGLKPGGFYKNQPKPPSSSKGVVTSVEGTLSGSGKLEGSNIESQEKELGTKNSKCSPDNDEEEIPEEDEKNKDDKLKIQHFGIYSMCIKYIDVNIAGLARSKKVVKRPKKDSKTELAGEEQKSDPNDQRITLKDTKAPDPFEAQHKRTECELGGIIATTASPDNPLYHLRHSGVNTPALQRAHRHFVISLFESILFVQKMKPVPDTSVLKQKLTLPRPKNLLSKSFIVIIIIADKTLFLDLDECLVHCVNEGDPADVHLTIDLANGEVISVSTYSRLKIGRRKYKTWTKPNA
jgi:hypothetical protein